MTTDQTTEQRSPLGIWWQDHLSPTYSLHEHKEAAREEMRGWLEQQAQDDTFEQRCKEARDAIVEHHLPTTFQQVANALASSPWTLQWLKADDRYQSINDRLIDWVMAELVSAVDGMLSNWAEAMEEMEAFEAKYPQRWS